MRALSRINPLHGPVVPEDNWEMAGTTPDGKQLYRERTPRTRAVPMFDENGERVYKQHPMTGEPLYPKNKAEHYIHERLFYVESDGQGNQEKIDWAPPTEEQIRAQQRERAVNQMLPSLAGALVDEGISVDAFVSSLKEQKKSATSKKKVAAKAQQVTEEGQEL